MHLEVLREHKGGDCISTGKKVCVCVCVCVCVRARSSTVRRVLDSGRQLPQEDDFVTGLKSLFYLFLGEALSVTESLCA